MLDNEVDSARTHSRESVLHRAFAPIGRWLILQGWVQTGLRYIPPLLSWRRRLYSPRLGSWGPVVVSVPASLLSQPGIPRDDGEETMAFQTAPLRNLIASFPHLTEALFQNNWDVFLALGPRFNRAITRAKRSATLLPAAQPSRLDNASLTRSVKARAAELGISAIGIAKYDHRFTFAPSQAERGWACDRIIVCLLETNYDAIQSVPSARAEKAAISASQVLMDLGAELASHLNELGFHAAPIHNAGFGVHINYAVEAGLGQLGMNGQLLTPIAGSRVRMSVIQTDAPLDLDRPIDYGIPKICDACKVCVRRCPPGAIPSRRQMYRGIEKAKIKLTRCWPTTVQAHGCAICTKVCPVQRFGLAPVLNEYRKSGRILGKDTDDLEGYQWIDGRHYSVGERPKVNKVWFDQPMFATLTDDAASPARYAKEQAEGADSNFLLSM
jgi:epoxyqueuosine reductase